MPARLWYLRVNGLPTGPFEPRELRRLAADGRLAPNDRLRCTGDPKWHRARKIVGLFDRPAGSAADSPPGSQPDAADPLAREFNDVSVILRREHLEQARSGNRSAGMLPLNRSPEAARRPAKLAVAVSRPEPLWTAPVIGVAAITAIVTYFGIAFLAAKVVSHEAPPTAAVHEPTVVEAGVSARDAIIARTDPKTAEVTRLELIRQTERDSETSPAWFTFRGEVRWTNHLGAPVEADFGVIVRYDPRQSAYVPDLVTRDGRVLAAEVEICGQPRQAELESLAHELFER